MAFMIFLLQPFFKTNFPRAPSFLIIKKVCILVKKTSGNRFPDRQKPGWRPKWSPIRNSSPSWTLSVQLRRICWPPLILWATNSPSFWKKPLKKPGVCFKNLKRRNERIRNRPKTPPTTPETTTSKIRTKAVCRFCCRKRQESRKRRPNGRLLRRWRHQGHRGPHPE